MGSGYGRRYITAGNTAGGSVELSAMASEAGLYIYTLSVTVETEGERREKKQRKEWEIRTNLQFTYAPSLI